MKGVNEMIEFVVAMIIGFTSIVIADSLGDWICNIPWVAKTFNCGDDKEKDSSALQH